VPRELDLRDLIHGGLRRVLVEQQRVPAIGHKDLADLFAGVVLVVAGECGRRDRGDGSNGP